MKTKIEEYPVYNKVNRVMGVEVVMYQLDVDGVFKPVGSRKILF